MTPAIPSIQIDLDLFIGLIEDSFYVVEDWNHYFKDQPIPTSYKNHITKLWSTCIDFGCNNEELYREKLLPLVEKLDELRNS